MEFSISMPIILFPAISLILLAYTEKLVQLARLLRALKAQYNKENAGLILSQIENLKKRIYLIRYMQAFGTASFFLCIFTIFLLYTGLITPAMWFFSISMLSLMIALVFTFQEVRLSASALRHALDDSD